MLAWTKADSEHIRQYLIFVRRNKPRIGYFGDVRQDEIEIVTHPDRIRDCVEAVRSRLVRAANEGTPLLQTPSDIWRATLPGVVYQCQYGLLVRFPVLFPPRQRGGEPALGLYLIWYWQVSFGRQGEAFGLPILPDGRVVLVRAFRHATRCWTLDIPGGGTDAKTALEALREELRQEAGLELMEAIPLGSVSRSPGLIGGEVPVFLARVQFAGKVEREESEAILSPLTLSITDLESAMREGYWKEQVSPREFRTYSVNASTLFFAFTKARLLGLL